MKGRLAQIEQHTVNAINILRRLHNTNGGRGGPKVNKRLGEELGRIQRLVSRLQLEAAGENADQFETVDKLN